MKKTASGREVERFRIEKISMCRIPRGFLTLFAQVFFIHRGNNSLQLPRVKGSTCLSCLRALNYYFRIARLDASIKSEDMKNVLGISRAGILTKRER